MNITETGGTLQFKKKPIFDFSQERTVQEENQKCVHWIFRLSNRD